MTLDLATLASASFLSKEDRRAYLTAMEADAKRQPAAQPKAKRQKVDRKPAEPLATSEARHAWLEDAAAFCATLIKLCSDADVPAQTRVTIGWPGVGGARGKRIGECWSDRSSADSHVEIFVSPRSHESVGVLVTVLHELIHAAVGVEHGHKAPFARVARACGLEGKMTQTPPGEDLRALFAAYVATRGPYPAGAMEGMQPGVKKQKTNLLKAECDACGLIFRITAKWCAETLHCPAVTCGGLMRIEDLGEDDEAPDED